MAYIGKIIAVVSFPDGIKIEGGRIMECKREENLLECTCSATKCGNRGICCECVRHHREAGQIPGCFFPKWAELKHDRSIEYFIKVWNSSNQ